MAERYVSYIRTSTKKQSLGLVAQRGSIARFIQADGGELLEEYSEHESGKDNDRKALRAAMARAKRENAVLIVAKLDRLSRRASFITALMDEKDIKDFRVAELPSATRLTLHILAVVAEEERRLISERTKAGLQVIKDGIKPTKTGNPLGSGRPENGAAVSAHVRSAKADAFARCLAKKIDICKQTGAKSLRQIAEKLNDMEVKTQRGGKWYAANLRDAMLRLA